jgi:toxin ParE1/3/4
VTFSQRAADDIEEVRAFISADNPGAASKVAADLVRAAQRLGNMPGLGRPGRVDGTRELIVPPYVVVYTVIGNVVWILRVLHGAQKWPQDE